MQGRLQSTAAFNGKSKSKHSPEAVKKETREDEKWQCYPICVVMIFFAPHSFLAWPVSSTSCYSFFFRHKGPLCMVLVFSMWDNADRAPSSMGSILQSSQA